MKNIIRIPHHRPEIEGTFGVVTRRTGSPPPWHGDLEKGGNRSMPPSHLRSRCRWCEPHLNGPGGDVPVIPERRAQGKARVWAGRGDFAARARRRPGHHCHYRSLGLDMCRAPPCSRLRAGDVRHMEMLLRDYGTMKLADVLIPRSLLRSQGHPLVERANATSQVEELSAILATSAAVYLPGGKAPPTARCSPTRRWPRLIPACCARPRGAAATASARSRRRASPGARLRREAIDRFCRTQEVMDTSGEPHRGVLTGDDIAGWEAQSRRR